MKTIETTLTTTAIYSDDDSRKYLIQKNWDSSKPALTIILLAPSTSDGIALDNTTQRTIGNVDRLGFGSVSIVNLFSKMEDLTNASDHEEDPDNMKTILEEARKCDVLVYAPGNGKTKNLIFQKRAIQVLKQLKPFEKKMKCLSNEDGSIKHCHPLYPAVRTWYLCDTTISEEIQPLNAAMHPPKPVGRPKKLK